MADARDYYRLQAAIKQDQRVVSTKVRLLSWVCTCGCGCVYRRETSTNSFDLLQSWIYASRLPRGRIYCFFPSNTLQKDSFNISPCLLFINFIPHATRHGHGLSLCRQEEIQYSSRFDGGTIDALGRYFVQDLADDEILSACHGEPSPSKALHREPSEDHRSIDA